MEEFIQQLLTGLALFAVLCLLGFWIGSGSSYPNPDYIGCTQYDCY
jgi:hypothetical protein